jgi:hypothetical protein
LRIRKGSHIRLSRGGLKSHRAESAGSVTKDAQEHFETS